MVVKKGERDLSTIVFITHEKIKRRVVVVVAPAPSCVGVVTNKKAFFVTPKRKKNGNN